MPAVVTRTNQADIRDPAVKNTFINGINAFNSLPDSRGEIGGSYGTLVSIHRHPHKFHSTGEDVDVGKQRFLTWHRVYLSVLEWWVQTLPNCQNFSIPYWDWTVDRDVPDWLQNFKPRVIIPDTERIPTQPPQPIQEESVDVNRTPGRDRESSLPTRDDIKKCLEKPTFTDFTTTLELLHAHVHGWVGGTMSDILTSPADPLFWLHHANIDRIYTTWRTQHADTPSTIPTLSGSDLKMDPWEGTEPDYRHWDWVAYDKLFTV
jgi:hypothetical protein